MSTSTWTGTATINVAALPGAVNQIQFQAIDTLGIPSTITTVTVLGIDPSGTSPNPPVFTVAEPAQAQTVLTGSDGLLFEVTGQVTADNGVAQLLVDGQPTPFDSLGNFDTFIILRIGQNTLTLIATDAAQPPLTSTVSFLITLNQGAPPPVDIEISSDQIRMGVRVHERGVE